MKNTPESGWRPQPRGASNTSLKENAGGEAEDEQGGLGSTNAGSTTNLGAMEDHNHTKSMADEIDSSSRDIGYGCKPTRQHLASDRGPTLQQSELDAFPAARTTKDISAAESEDPSTEPPVTKATLSELDVPRIVYNPKLRHDVNFDPDLHFRPNLDGESGRRKAQKADDFWNRLRTQLEKFMADPAAFENKLGSQEWYLRSTLQAIGEILATLVPPEDRSSVEETLNVELLLQQFRKGVADLEKLALWLACTLKSHCAPMRDEWVDEMVTQLTVGDRDRDVASLVQGLQGLLGVLEAMKLDVANHQIRCLRPLLIQDTVEFEQTFFMKKIALRKIDIGGAHAWFRAAKSLSDHDQLPSTPSQRNMWVFFKGFANLLLPSKIGASTPDTFMFDDERIIKLRLDVLDAINLDVCFRLSESIHSNDQSQETQIMTVRLAPSRSPLRSASLAPTLEAYNSNVRSPTPLSLPKVQGEVEVSHSPKSSKQLNKQTSLEELIWITEPDSGDDDSDTESPASSRRASFSSTTSTSITSPLSRSVEASLAPVDIKARQSILAIVDDTAGSNRWQQSCSDIALELLRSTPSHNDLSRLESLLHLHLSNPTSAVLQASECHILAELYPLLSHLVARYASLSATQLFEIATSPRPLLYQVQIPRHALSDVVKQMAHIGILHWRVWEKLAYLVDPDDAGHVTDTTDPESRKAGKAWEQVVENNGRPRPQRQNSISESIPTGS